MIRFCENSNKVIDVLESKKTKMPIKKKINVGTATYCHMLSLNKVHDGRFHYVGKFITPRVMERGLGSHRRMYYCIIRIICYTMYTVKCRIFSSKS